MKLSVGWVVVGLSLCCVVPVLAQQTSSLEANTAVPTLVNFSSVLTDVNGKPLTGVVGVTFYLYQEQQGGAPLWLETQNVQPDKTGHYTVALGSTTSYGLPTDIFVAGEARWLGVQAQGQAEQPRVLLLSVPYALKAGDAETLGGKPASAYALAGAPALLAAGTSGPAGPATAAEDGGSGVRAATACGSVTSDGTAVANTLAFFTTPCNLESSVISQSSSGNVGIGATAPSSNKLYVFNIASNFGTAWIQQNYFNTTATTNGTNYALAMDMNLTGMTIPAGVTDSGYRAALIGRAYPQTTDFAGTLAQEYGVYGFAGIFQATSGAKVGTATAGQFQIFNQQPGTTITNAYGVYISNASTGGTITNRYDLYASSPNANNYFAGNVGVGTTSPGANLEVNGTAKFDGMVTFASGQAFTGSGAGLTNVSAANSSELGGLASSAYAQLAAANSFTGTTNSFTGVVTAATIFGSGTSGATGVIGTSDTGLGVYGIVDSLGAEEAGVLGVGNANSDLFEEFNIYSGVWGDTGTSSTTVAPAWAVGVIGTADDSHAGVFLNNSTNWSTLYVNNYGTGDTGLFTTLNASTRTGTCGVGGNGDLTCTGQVKTLAAIGGGARQVETYTMQSPENWMEDFGSGALERGVAVVNIDPAFAETVSETADYHVFITPNGDSKGLYVIHKTAASFEVRESGGGTSSLSFDYRIVAKRRGYEAQRLTDATERFKAEQKSLNRHLKAQARTHPGPSSLVPASQHIAAKQLAPTTHP
jgi:hypothetical protein